MGRVKRNEEVERPSSVKWYTWFVLSGLLIGLVQTLVDRPDVEASFIAILFVFLFTYGIIAVLLRGVWRGSRLAWILSVLFDVGSVVLWVSRGPEMADLVVGLLTTVLPMFWLFHRDTRAWCRVVL